MLGLERGWKGAETDADALASLPAGWIGAPSLMSLTPHLREFGAGAPGFVGELAAALFAIDDESRALLDAERRRYFEFAGSGAVRAEVVWQIGRTFLGELFSALSDLLLRDCYAGREGDLSEVGRTELLVRALRAGAGAVAWDAFHYGPFEESLWARLGQVFSLAVERGDAGGDVLLPDSHEEATTPRREFLYAVALRCAGFDGLPVERMDEVDRLIRRVLPWLTLRQGDASDALFQLQIGDPVGPRRITASGKPDPAGWFFSVAASLENELDGVPKDARLAWCLAHLDRQWAHRPARRHRRHAMEGELEMAQRWDEMLAFLAGRKSVPPKLISVEDVSRGGFRARVDAEASLGARVGDLIGLHPQGGADWQLSVVRRVQRNKDRSALLGVETVTKAPVVLEADDGCNAARGVLCDPLRQGGIVRFLTRTNSLRRGVPVFLKAGAAVLKLEPHGRAARWRSCELQSFRVL